MVRATGSTTTLVIMGVAGSGKSAVATELHRALGWPTLDADDLHPAENLALLSAGVPLDDAHREPWLRAVAAWAGDPSALFAHLARSASDTAGRLTSLLRLGAVDPA